MPFLSPRLRRDTQIAYPETVHDNSGVNQYAQRIVITPGRHPMGSPGRILTEPRGGFVGEVVASGLAEGSGMDGSLSTAITSRL